MRVQPNDAPRRAAASATQGRFREQPWNLAQPTRTTRRAHRRVGARGAETRTTDLRLRLDAEQYDKAMRRRDAARGRAA